MTSLFTVTTDYLTAKNLRYSSTEDRTSLTVCFRLDNTCATCLIAIDEEGGYLSFCTRSGLIVAEDKFGAVAEFIARANYGLGIGAFQFNHEKGDVFFKTSLFAADTEIASEAIRHLLYKNINTYDRLYPALVDVIYRDIAPAQALRSAKDKTKSRRPQEEIDAVFAKLMARAGEAQLTSGFDQIRAQAEQRPDGILLPMKDLVSASGQRRAGKHIVQRIAQSLQAHGLGHIPTALPHNQDVIVRVFKMENAG